MSEEWTAIAREHWEQAGVADRIELRIGPAADTLRALPADPPIDLAFIDADKPGYRTYYEEIVAAAPARRAGAARQRAVERQRRRRRATRARTPWRSAPSTTTSPPTTASRP